MAFASLDDLIAGMASKAYRTPFTRASLSSQVAGHETSHWRGSGFPAQGAVPTAAAICTNALAGALPLATRAGAEQRILAGVSVAMAAAGHCLMIEDRIGHMGGLVGNVITAQTVNLDIHANIGVSNVAERIGAANYSELEWYLEWYTATGATVSTPTAAVTFHDGTTGTVNAWVLGATALPATVNVGRRYKLNPTNGKFIRSVQSVTLSASTGTAGNFGVTCVRRLAEVLCQIANYRYQVDWSALTAPKIADSACVTTGQLSITTTSGATAGTFVQAVA